MNQFFGDRPPDENGVYVASFKMLLDNKKLVKEKESTMFPKGWSNQKLSEELLFAYRNKKPIDKSNTLFESATISGVPIQIIHDEDGKFKTLYPIRRN